ncbi:MAG: nitroreductase family protein [Christensenellaceae bacterium]|jgi:nitroreductase|nr:nitroreductase family protein [Christensenellaceae bacterium]
MNDTLLTIARRFSCRDFIDKPICESDLLTICKSALASPSGMNRQNWQIVLIENKVIIKEMEDEGLKNLQSYHDKTLYNRIMGRGGKLFYNAPCMIIIAIKERFPKGAELIDLGIVSQNISLAATSMGIDNCHCGFAAFCFAGTKGTEFKQKLQFFDGYECGLGVLLGYARESKKPHDLNLEKLTIIN